MMTKSRNQVSELLSEMNFPEKGEVLNGKKIINSSAALEDDILKYEIILPK